MEQTISKEAGRFSHFETGHWNRPSKRGRAFYRNNKISTIKENHAGEDPKHMKANATGFSLCEIEICKELQNAWMDFFPNSNAGII